MTMRKISEDNLPKLYAALAKNAKLWLPYWQEGRSEFALWDDKKSSGGSDKPVVDLAGKTGKSAKELIFPQNEEIVSFKSAGKKIDIKPAAVADAPFVVFGVRGCDARAMQVLDRVFLSDPKDSLYAARREAGTIITLACAEPDESCFCGAFAIDPENPGGDVETWLVGGNLYWKDLTEKGKRLTDAVAAALGDDFPAAGPEGERLVVDEKVKIAEAQAATPFAGLKPAEIAPNATEPIFEADLWQKASESCLGCGTCTFLCPTCQCYDILDRTASEGVRRLRCWDSCMYSDFTLMAHGNPRTTQLQRFRQRFMHKLVYFPQNNDGMYSCVGCGRCVEKCPSGLNIVNIMRKIKARHEAPHQEAKA